MTVEGGELGHAKHACDTFQHPGICLARLNAGSVMDDNVGMGRRQARDNLRKELHMAGAVHKDQIAGFSVPLPLFAPGGDE